MNTNAGDEIRRRLTLAEADRKERNGILLTAIEGIYSDPRKVLQRMQSFVNDHGDKALAEKLEKDPAYFGAMRGYPGSGNALTLQGMRDRGVSQDLAKILPGLVRSALEADSKVLGLEKAYFQQATLGRGGPDRGSGPDFT